MIRLLLTVVVVLAPVAATAAVTAGAPGVPAPATALWQEEASKPASEPAPVEEEEEPDCG